MYEICYLIHESTFDAVKVRLTMGYIMAYSLLDIPVYRGQPREQHLVFIS